MLAKLKASLLTEKHAKALKLEAFEEGHGLVSPDWAGFKIPYFDLDGKETKDFYRFRFTEPGPSSGWASLGAPEKPRRYAQPSGSTCGVYFPPLLEGTWREVAEDPAMPVCITEGELKAACACVCGLPPSMGLGGVYNWMSGKNHLSFLPELDEFEWAGRVVYIVFDSDVATNLMVRQALGRLSRKLSDRGVKEVQAVQLPQQGDNKVGLDDYAFENGKDALAELMKETTAVGPAMHLHQLNAEVAVLKATAEVIELSSANVWKPAQFTELAYKQRQYKDWSGKVEVVKFTAKEWLAWPHRNELERMVYTPGAPRIVGKDYNMWAGWGCEPMAGDIKPWENLFANMFGNLDEAKQLWLKRWLAYPIQHPGTKLYQAVLVWGRRQGTGKTLLGETMARIYGSNYGTVNNTQLTGAFNEWCVGKQFIVGDEIALGDKRHTTNMLKDMVTRTELRVNIKNRQTFSIRDCINYYFTSNHADAVYLEGEDRRFFVHEVETEPLPAAEYKAYAKWLAGPGGQALFQYLNTLDLGDFDPHGRAPMTNSKAEMAAAGRGDVEDWCALLSQDPDTALATGYDLYRTLDLLKAIDPEGKEKVRAVGLGRALGAAGVKKVARGNNSMVIEGMRTSLWAVRNPDRYKLMGPTSAKEAYVAERASGPKGVGANGKFMRNGKREIVQ